MRSLAATVCFLLAAAGSVGEPTWRTVERVIDGDTIVVDGGERVRLIGVDTPETVHPTKPVARFGREGTVPGVQPESPRGELSRAGERPAPAVRGVCPIAFPKYRPGPWPRLPVSEMSPYL